MTQRRSADRRRIRRTTRQQGLSRRYEAPETVQGASQGIEKGAGAALIDTLILALARLRRLELKV